MLKVVPCLLVLFLLASGAFIGTRTLAQGVIQVPQCVIPTDRPGIPVVSVAAVNTQVLKAAPGCLIGVYLTIGGAGATGYLMLFNSITVPADGAVTPLECLAIAAAPNTASMWYGDRPPEAFTVGISASYSSTGCFTKTTPGTAVGFFHAIIQ